MLAYVAKRTAWAVMLFLSITLVTYIVFFVIPGEGARRGRGTAAVEMNLPESYAVEGPIYREYPLFLWNVVRHGELGASWATREPITELLARAAPVTLSLVLGAAALWLLIAFPVGVLSALRPRSLLDRVTMLLVLVGVSVHPLWIGLILSYVGGYKLGLFPLNGYCDVFNPSGSCGGPTQWAYHMLLPWATLAFLFAALYTRMVRATVIETMHEDHIRTARAKGASSWRIVRVHVLRNALLPIAGMLSMDLGVAIAGSFFVEIAFGLPGLGMESLRAVRRRDLPVIVGVVVATTTAITVLTFLLDLVHGALDPRVRGRAAPTEDRVPATESSEELSGVTAPATR